ncbi:MAG TPA: EAL domain-containing protein [Bryobacteraceae bacterium]|nr:EAL domain-containing protein [Bryobacteraceae bacterium]
MNSRLQVGPWAGRGRRLAAAFRNSSIRTKVWLLIFMTTSLALVLAGAGFLVYESVQYRRAATREMSALAEIVAASNTAALSFNDERAARETLAALRGDQRLLAAAVYDQAGRPFAIYRSPAAGQPPPGRPRRDGAYFENGTLLVYQPVLMAGDRIGTILLQSSLSELRERLRRYSGLVVLVLTASLLLALLPVAALQRVITGPIASLSKVAHRISSEKNYSIRAEKHAQDEIGLLIDSFNDMLGEIQGRDASLQESEERYALAAQGANDGLWDWKLATNQIYFSTRWKQMLGYSDSEITPDPEEWFSRIHAADRERVRSEIFERQKEAERIFASEYRIRQKTGGYIWVSCRGVAVRDASGTLVRLAGSQSDITQEKVVDPLTGLRNRLYFLDRLESLIEAAAKDPSFAVLFLDVDRFKVVNDSLGHEAGDRLLVEIAGRLQSSVRATDVTARLTAPPVLARFGGDEFAVLVERVRRQSDAEAVAERILAQFRSPFDIRGHLIFATASIGVTLGSSGRSSQDLLRNADTAMYYAKARGKARFEVFNEGMRERAVARMELESDLRAAIEDAHLVLYYQPEVSLRTGRVVGYEALIRWNHPERGMVMPAEFLPLAEETGLIIPIGRWVLKEACRQMAEWHRNFPLEPPLAISVNLSSKEMADPELVANVAGTLAETGLDPGCLRIELTESSILEDFEMTVVTLRRLKELRISLEIDDFGTGYSSLSRLHEFPFDTVKIDRSFVKDLETESESLHLVETIVNLAHSLGLGVVAEGIETRQQLERLAALGCGYGQGYYFSKPADRHSVQKFIQEKARQEQAARSTETREPGDSGMLAPALSGAPSRQPAWPGTGAER